MTGQVTTRIRVGLVGANPNRSWAMMAHLPALAALPEVELVAVATTRIESAQACADLYGVPMAFASAEELAAHPDVDLVVAAVKAPAHAAVIRAALAAGKHVLSEWPLGANTDEAIALAAEADAAGVVNAVSLQGVHSPGVRYVHDLIAEGHIGRVESLSLVTSSGFGGSRISQARAWTADPRAGVSLLSITGGHMLASLATMVGPLHSLYAVTATLTDEATVSETGEVITVGTPDQIALVGGLEGGGVVSIMLHGNTPPAAGGFRLRITGSTTTLLIDSSEAANSLHHGEWAITAVDATDNSVVELSVPAQYRLVPAEVPPGPPTNIAAVYREVAAAITEGRAAHPSFATAVGYHRLLSAAVTASDTGHRQPIG